MPDSESYPIIGSWKPEGVQPEPEFETAVLNTPAVKNEVRVLYDERHHIHYLVSSLARPFTLLMAPIALYVFWRIMEVLFGSLQGQGVIMEALASAFEKIYQALAGLVNEFLAIALPFLILAWALVVIWFVAKSFYDWANTRLIVTEDSVEYVRADLWILNLTGGKEKLTSSDVRGVLADPALIDKILFRGCADIKVLIKDLEGRASKEDSRFALPAIGHLEELEAAIDVITHQNQVREGK